MPTVEDVFESALQNEPPGPDLVAPVIAAAGRRRRRAQIVGSAALAAVVAGGAGVLTLGRAGQVQPPSRDVAAPMSIAQLQRLARGAASTDLVASRYSLAAVSSRARSGHLTASSLPGLVEAGADVTLADIVVTRLRDGDLNLSAAVSRSGGALAAAQELSVQIAPAGSLTTTEPSCAELSALPGGDGFSGPCQVRPVRAGGFMVVRNGRTATGGFTKAEADLVRADGSGILAEVTNQGHADRSSLTSVSRKGPDGTRLYVVSSPRPPVSELPPVSADHLARLVRVLDGRR